MSHSAKIDAQEVHLLHFAVNVKMTGKKTNVLIVTTIFGALEVVGKKVKMAIECKKHVQEFVKMKIMCIIRPV